MKTIHEAPVVENIIEKKNIEIHNRNVIKEVHEQPIIEIERRQEMKFVEQQPVENRVVAETRYEEVGERMMPHMPTHNQQTNVVPTVETSVSEKTLPPIIETVIERPVYKQVIIEQHEIPVQTIYTTVPVIHPQVQQQPLLEGSSFQFNQVNTELQHLQQTVTTHQQQPLMQQGLVGTQQPLMQQGMQQGIDKDKLRTVRSGYGKSVWGLSHGGELFRMSRQAKLGMMWERFNFHEGFVGHRFIDFSVVKSGYIWLLGEDHMLYFLDPKTRHENMLRPMIQNMSLTGFPRFKSISAYDDSHCYMLGEDGSVFLYDSAKLLRLNGQLKSLSAGNPHRRLFGKHFELWGIGFDDQAKRWNGTDSWLDMGVVIRDVAVGVDNSVYAIDGAGQLLKWAHNANRFEAVRSNTTTSTPMQFTGVSVFKDHRGVYTVDAFGNVYSMDA